MNEENIKLGECACCHNVRKVHRVHISYLRFAFLCDECDVPLNRLQKTTQKTNSANIISPTK